MNQALAKWPMTDASRVSYNTHTDSGIANYFTENSSMPNAMIERVKNQIVICDTYERSEEFVVLTDDA